MLPEKSDEEFVFVQCGFTAARDPYGMPLPSVPMYRKVKRSEVLPNGLTKDLDSQIKNLSGFFVNMCNERLEMTPQGLRKKALPEK